MTTPTVAVANLSPWRQSRWCAIPMACSQADGLPEHCLIDGKWLATRGQRLGQHTQMWHCYIDLEGHASGPLMEWRGIPTFPAFVMSPWLTDDVEKSKLRVEIVDHNHRAGFQLALDYKATEFDGLACKVWRLEAHAAGWHVWCYATIWSGQDVVDLAVRAVWSDRDTPSCRPTETASIQILAGEPLHGWGPDRGLVMEPTRVIIYRGPQIHGYPIDWRGALGALPNEGVHGSSEMRLRNIWAARGGPIVGDSVWPEGEWLALGVVPNCSSENLQRQWVDYAAVTRSYHRERPLGLHLYAGGSGDQPPYGSTKCGEGTGGRPWRIPMLLDGAGDPRAIFHYENDGTPVTRQTHPGLLTWEGLIDTRNSTDRLGKSANQDNPNWATVEGRQVQVDDQHHGGLYRVAAFALTGDYLVRDYMVAELRVEESRSFANLWRDDNPTSWSDAPRAEGRLMLSNASKPLLLPETTQTVRRLANRSMQQRDAVIPKTGEVRPAFTLVHGSVLPDGQLATMPWHAGIFCTGLLAHHQSMLKLGLTEDAASALELAIRVGRDVVQWGTVRASWGQLLPITGLKVLPGGAANPPSYYTFPRAGASTTGVFQPGDDMLVGSAGWWSWFAGAIAATLHGTVDAVYERAREIWDANAGGGSVAWSEWFAIPIPARDGSTRSAEDAPQ